MHRKIYVLKEELAAHVKWEEFVHFVYSSFKLSAESEVMDLADHFPILEWREVDGNTFIDGTKCEECVAEGCTKVSADDFIRAIAPHLLKTDHSKRKKGPSRKSPSVNKAVILFMSGETYTVKGFVSLEATAEKTVFIMEDTWKDTVNSRNAITVYNEDVAQINVRGIKHQVVLDMALKDKGTLVLHSQDMLIFLSDLTISE
nr:MAG TPA: hypothetical protein [Caudoviricetes sp.]